MEQWLHYKKGGFGMRRVYKSIIALSMIAGLAPGTIHAQGSFKDNITWLVQAGAYHGSIVGRNRVDAVSGATRTSVGGSVAAEVKVLGQYLSLGINVGQTGQSIDYKDTANAVTGGRDLSLLLVDVPLLYNFHFFKNPSGGRDNPRLVIGLGVFLSLLADWRVADDGSTPPATLSRWGCGPYLRAAGYPFAFGRFQPGLYLDVYRSFVPRLYDEVYFRQNSISGQLGILTGGLSLRF